MNYVMLSEDDQDLSLATAELENISSVSASYLPLKSMNCMPNGFLVRTDAGDDSLIEQTGYNVFGIIKDVKINNIVASDADKTEKFQTKNFKQIFYQSPVNVSQGDFCEMPLVHDQNVKV